MSTSHRVSPLAVATPVLVKKLVTLERSGRYEEGLRNFGVDYWDPEVLPPVDPSSQATSAEILLRFGSLIGFWGAKDQITGAQERAKNVLTAARDRFSALNDHSKQAECENHLALAYWRTGEHNEAQTWVEAALDHKLGATDDARLYSLVTKTLINLSQRRYQENIDMGVAAERDFQAADEPFLYGSLCSNIALSYKNLWLNAEALRYFDLARQLHERSRHKIYLATVYNNTAQVHKAEQRYALAHEAVDTAIALFRKAKDKTREAYGFDTKAQIYLHEHRSAEAVAAAETALAILRNGEVSTCLAETILTKAKALVLQGNMVEAVTNLVEAVNITRINDSEDAAKNLITEFSQTLTESNVPPLPSVAAESGELELILPPSMGHYREYKGIWINSDHLEPFGIRSGSLAVVVPDALKRGDLAAIAENGSDDVICGVYDSEFGIVCLERGEDEPQLFSENDIRVIGKIVGYCSAARNPDGKMTVRPIIT